MVNPLVMPIKIKVAVTGITAHGSLARLPLFPRGNVPHPATNTPPGSAVSNLEQVLGWAAWTVSGLCVAGILIVAGRMAVMHHHGRGGEHATGLAWVMAAMILAASASAIVGAIL